MTVLASDSFSTGQMEADNPNIPSLQELTAAAVAAEAGLVTFTKKLLDLRKPLEAYLAAIEAGQVATPTNHLQLIQWHELLNKILDGESGRVRLQYLLKEVEISS